MIQGFDAARVVADLKHLRDLTSDTHGAQRVAWTDGWAAARKFYRELLDELGLESELDEAGNLWTYVPSSASSYLAVGSHLDSVPNGGWLDGALGVMSGVGLARAWDLSVESGLGLALVDFADEEGARFGRSLFGSSAVSGSLDLPGLEDLIDRDGHACRDVIAEHGVDRATISAAQRRLDNLVGYVELHIEQGPVLEAEGADIGIVEGVVGIERFEVELFGQAGHAGATPMRLRKDPVAALASGLVQIEELARTMGGLATVGVLDASPGVVTVVPGQLRLTLDLRHADEGVLADLTTGAKRALGTACRERGCTDRWRSLWRIAPTGFDRGLLTLADQAAQVHGRSMRLLSGPGHDAVEMARWLPTAMMFAPSRDGLSHVREEDTDEEQLLRAVGAFGAWAGLILSRD